MCVLGVMEGLRTVKNSIDISRHTYYGRQILKMRHKVVCVCACMNACVRACARVLAAGLL